MGAGDARALQSSLAFCRQFGGVWAVAAHEGGGISGLGGGWGFDHDLIHGDAAEYGGAGVDDDVVLDQRMARQVTLLHEQVDVVLVPAGERVHLVSARGKLEHRQAHPGAAMEAFAAGDPGVIALQRPLQRLGGGIALAVAGMNAGVQLLRVHDVAETVQARNVWRGLRDAALTDFSQLPPL